MAFKCLVRHNLMPVISLDNPGPMGILYPNFELYLEVSINAFFSWISTFLATKRQFSWGKKTFIQISILDPESTQKLIQEYSFFYLMGYVLVRSEFCYIWFLYKAIVRREGEGLIKVSKARIGIITEKKRFPNFVFFQLYK